MVSFSLCTKGDLNLLMVLSLIVILLIVSFFIFFVRINFSRKLELFLANYSIFCLISQAEKKVSNWLVPVASEIDMLWKTISGKIKDVLLMHGLATIPS